VRNNYSHKNELIITHYALNIYSILLIKLIIVNYIIIVLVNNFHTSEFYLKYINSKPLNNNIFILNLLLSLLNLRNLYKENFSP